MKWDTFSEDGLLHEYTLSSPIRTDLTFEVYGPSGRDVKDLHPL